MKITDLSSFKKTIAEKAPRMCLILGKECEEAVEVLYKIWKSPITVIDSERFSSSHFLQETETLPFLSKNTFLHVKGVDQLKAADLEVIITYVAHPNSWVNLLITGQQLSPSHALIKRMDEQGCVLRLAEEKPWEKEKQLIPWLMEEAAKENKQMTSPIAKALLKEVGTERELLRREVEKLICYIGKRSHITHEDIRAVVCRTGQETLWQLGEAIFRLNRPLVISIANGLVEEGETVFSLIGHLRAQVRQGMEILSLQQTGGVSAVTAHFPYLKGNLLQKKIEEVQNYGYKRFKRALLHLFDFEVRSKNSGDDPLLLLELLLTHLTG